MRCSASDALKAYKNEEEDGLSCPVEAIEGGGIGALASSEMKPGLLGPWVFRKPVAISNFVLIRPQGPEIQIGGGDI